VKIAGIWFGLLAAGLLIGMGAIPAAAQQGPSAKSGTILFSSNRAGPWRI